MCCLSSMPSTDWTGVMQMYVAAPWNRGREAVLGSSRPPEASHVQKSGHPTAAGGNNCQWDIISWEMISLWADLSE